jgi:uncharacterized protein YjbI with pentapeptide repeats
VFFTYPLANKPASNRHIDSDTNAKCSKPANKTIRKRHLTMSQRKHKPRSSSHRHNSQKDSHVSPTSDPIQQPRPPAHDDYAAWHPYWQAQDQPWRTEPEINPERQQELTARRTILPDIAKGIYPFKDIKLSRADVEWLLATHEGGRGPVEWRDERQREREGLDLRGADLRNVDLQSLPLARLRGSLTWKEGPSLTSEQRKAADILLDRADFTQTHLEGARLAGIHLENAELRRTYLQEAYLIRIHLETSFLNEVHLERANLTGAYMEGAFLRKVQLGDENRIGPRLVDIQWGETNLAIVNWEQVKLLDDEYKARQTTLRGKKKDTSKLISEYERAVRANRQLSVALQSQGLNEDAARFAYRAQVLQKNVLRLQIVQPAALLKHRWRSFWSWLLSWFLFLLAGYGYRAERSFLAYLVIIGIFTILYHFLAPQLLWNETFVISMTAFHGRGFFPGTFSPGDPLALASALEAFVGLIIEVTFIATLTQRFFGK